MHRHSNCNSTLNTMHNTILDHHTHWSHLPNLFFEPYLINVRCSLSLKYVIQLEVP